MLLAADFLPARFNVASHFVDQGLGDRAGRTAFLCADRDLTYAEVAELVNRTGNALLELGISRGDRVLMACLDTPEFVGTFWGAIKIGAVPVPVNTLLRRQDYAYLLNDSQARAVVVSAALMPELAPALEHTRQPIHVLVAGGQRPRPSVLGRAGGALLGRARGCPHVAGRRRPSGSTRRDRPASPRAPCTFTTTW